MVISTVALAVLLFILLWYLNKYFKYRGFFNKLPGDNRFNFIFGNIHVWPGPNEEGIQYYFEQAKKFKHFSRLWVGPFLPVLILYHPDALRNLVKSSAPKPRNKLLMSPYDQGVQWLGEGLIIANGHRWARNRRLLTPAFHFEILKRYMDVYNSCTDTLIEKIKLLSESDSSFDIFEPISLHTLDVILRCACSYESNCQNEGRNVYTTALTEMVKLWSNRTLKPHLFVEFFYKYTTEGRRWYKLCDVVHDIAEQIIDKRRQSMSENKETSGKKNMDFLDILLNSKDEDGVGLTDLEIRNEVDTFLFAGHDTTASGISWTLYCLSQHPHYQQKVYDEVTAVLGDRENIEWSDLPSLEFTTMCIKETLRFHTAVPFIERKLEEDTVIAGHTIPKGTLVAMLLFILHHNPHLWDEPFTFNPSRFHPDKQKLMDPYQFLPFSAGQRNCIGQNFAFNEMKVTVARVIKNFELCADPKHNVRRFMTVTMRAENKALMYAKPRAK